MEGDDVAGANRGVTRGQAVVLVSLFHCFSGESRLEPPKVTFKVGLLATRRGVSGIRNWT